MSRFGHLAWLIALGSWLWSAAAFADAGQSGTILLVVDPRAVPLATRVAAELETLGFAVQTRSQEPEASQLANAARHAGAFAAIGIGPSAQGNVEITVLDRVTGKTVRRELLGRSLQDPTTRELVALRASELLRASLMEIEAPHPPRGDLPATSDVSQVARAPETIRRPEQRLRLGAETGVLLAPGLSMTPLLQASLGVRLVERLELRLGVGSQLTAGQRNEREGRIEALARWVNFGPRLMLLPRRQSSRVALGFDAGLGLIALSASGFASDAGHRGQSHFVWAAAGTLGIDSKIRLHKQLWWAIHPAVGFTTSELVLRADGRDVRVWGRPWLECATGVEVEL
jgi:hypothetical protein